MTYVFSQSELTDITLAKNNGTWGDIYAAVLSAITDPITGMIGRPVLYGLAAGGRQGVERALAILRAEIERTMALLGAPSISDLNAGYLLR